MNSLEAVLEASPDALLVVDRDGEIQVANRNVPDILGYDAVELEGMYVEDLLLEEDKENHVAFRQQYMESPEPRPMGRGLELYALHQDGTSVPVEISLGPVEVGDETLVIATIGDRSQVREREEQLERQNERLEEFASMVSHDLRNPLNVADGRLALAMKDCDSDHLEHVDRALDRMDALIDDLLLWGRAGNMSEQLESIDIESLSMECWPLVETHDATLEVQDIPPFRANRSRLQQLLENLIRNAVEHGGIDVTVTIGPLDTADGFFVEDDGVGIPPEQQDDVFDAGYSTTHEGNGLGLNIVQQIAEAHDWDVELEPSETGGARFEMADIEFISD